jgi:uncharacterized protein YpbB
MTLPKLEQVSYLFLIQIIEYVDQQNKQKLIFIQDQLTNPFEYHIEDNEEYF